MTTTTNINRPTSGQFKSLYYNVSKTLAEELISRGLKPERNLNDSIEWLPEVEALIAPLGIIPELAELMTTDWDLFEEVCIETMKSAPDHLDFSKASRKVKPPKMLKHRFTELVQLTAKAMNPPSVPRPDVSSFETIRDGKERSTAQVKKASEENAGKKVRVSKAKVSPRLKAALQAKGIKTVTVGADPLKQLHSAPQG